MRGGRSGPQGSSRVPRAPSESVAPLPGPVSVASEGYLSFSYQSVNMVGTRRGCLQTGMPSDRGGVPVSLSPEQLELGVSLSEQPASQESTDSYC